MPSYYYPELDQHKPLFYLEAEEFHHLSRVKRIASGARIKVNSGKGAIAECEVKELQKQRALLEIVEYFECQHPEIDFAIAFSLLKNHHDEMVVEKCTELGAAEFFPILTEHTVRESGKNTIERFKKIALAAIKQCDNPWLPQIHDAMTLKLAIKDIQSKGYQAIVCSEREQTHWMQDLDVSKAPCFIIGPEGGFSVLEHEFLQSMDSICISGQILRAETAAVCVASQYQILNKMLSKSTAQE